MQLTLIEVAVVNDRPITASVSPRSAGLFEHDSPTAVLGVRVCGLALPTRTVHKNVVPSGKLVPTAGIGVNSNVSDRFTSAYFPFDGSPFVPTWLVGGVICIVKSGITGGFTTFTLITFVAPVPLSVYVTVNGTPSAGILPGVNRLLSIAIYDVSARTPILGEGDGVIVPVLSDIVKVIIDN